MGVTLHAQDRPPDRARTAEMPDEARLCLAELPCCSGFSRGRFRLR